MHLFQRQLALKRMSNTTRVCKYQIGWRQCAGRHRSFHLCLLFRQEPCRSLSVRSICNSTLSTECGGQRYSNDTKMHSHVFCYISFHFPIHFHFSLIFFFFISFDPVCYSRRICRHKKAKEEIMKKEEKRNTHIVVINFPKNNST